MSSEYSDLTNNKTDVSSLTPLMKGIIHNASWTGLLDLMQEGRDTINVRCNQGRTAMNYAKRKGDQQAYNTLEKIGGVDLDENSKVEQNLSDDGAAAASDSNRNPQLPKGSCPCFQDPEMQKLLSSSDYIPGMLSNTSLMIMMFLSRFCTHRSTSSDEIDNISQEQGSPSSGAVDNISQEQGSSSSDGNYNINQGQSSSPANDGNYYIPSEKGRYSSDENYYLLQEQGSYP